MPLFFQQDIDGDTKLAIWKIEEEEAFFLRHVPLQRTITHPHKRLQHLAGRYLLKILFPDFPLKLIRIANTRKPFIENEAYHFSISHCSDYAAVMVSKSKRVGIDIEVFSAKIEAVKHKFISEGEWAVVSPQWSEATHILAEQQPIALLTLLWSCKESVFKWYGLGELDFRKHMMIQHFKPISDNKIKTCLLFQKDVPQLLNLFSVYFDGMVLSYIH